MRDTENYATLYITLHKTTNEPNLRLTSLLRLKTIILSRKKKNQSELKIILHESLTLHSDKKNSEFEYITY